MLTEEQKIKAQPLLTIAIPTYNRSAFLELCLRRIRDELINLRAEQRKQVEIVVSNNASTDDTADVISRNQCIEAGEFRVICNSENIGGERNVAQCYEIATTPYVWVLGDDDLILPGGLQSVLDVLLLQDVDILYVNNYWFSDDYKNIPSKREKHGVITYSTPFDFARKTNVMLTFISALVVRNRLSFDYQASVAAGSNLPQLGWVLPLLSGGKCFAYIEDWVVAAQGSNSGGYGLVKVFGINLVKITNEILKDMPSIASAIQNGTIVNFFPGFILEFRKDSSNFSDKDMASGLEAAFGNNWRYYVFLAPLIRLPLFAASYYNVLLKVFRRLFRSVLV